MSFAAAAALSGIASIGNTMLSQYYNKKNMRDQAGLQYAYAQRYAQNSPSWNVEGLRGAGLNPILAVSNGVNLGANIPNITNSSPEAKINIPAIEALKASKEVDIGQQNADSNSENSEANIIRAEADARLKDAQTLETIQRTEFEGQGKGYKNEIVNDLTRGLVQATEAYKDGSTSPESYLKHSPSDDFKPKYPSTPFGSVQNSIDERNWLSKETGISAYKLSKMPKKEYESLLYRVRKSKSSSNNSRGFHIFTR